MKHLLDLHWRSAKSALQGILRQPIGGFLNLLLMGVAISLPLCLYVLITSANEWSQHLAQSAQISLFMEQATEKADLAGIEAALQQHPAVANYQFISKETAFKSLIARNNMQDIAAAMGENPLPDAFVIYPKDTDPAAISRLEKEISGLAMVESTQYDAGWAQRLHQILRLGQQTTFMLSTVFGLALVLVTHNTIRLQILARRDEIEVSKLIGAPDSFIRRPFLYLALWQGGLAAVLGWLLSELFVLSAGPSIHELATLYNENANLHGLRFGELIFIVVASAALAMLGARLATGHHLRQIEPQ